MSSNCPDCTRRQEALDEAIIALDSSIQALVVARILVEKSSSGEPAPEPAPAPAPGMVVPCPHTETIDVSTMGGTQLMCQACSEVF